MPVLCYSQILLLPYAHQRRFDRVKRSQLVNHERPYFVWESDFAAVPLFFHYKSVLIVFLAISNISSSTVPSTNVFLGYRLVDLLDLGQ